MKPIIGINVDIRSGPPQQGVINCDYFRVIQKAGGIPILLAPMPDSDLDELLRYMNGLVLIGGPDYSPAKYGEDSSDLVKLCHPDREEFDFRLIDRTINKTDIPVLGICAGAQLLNVALGGSLIQDIKTEMPETAVAHNYTGDYRPVHMHEVTLEPKSQLAKVYKANRINVPTNHHQSVKKVGVGLSVTAHADDGIIEAIEMAGRPFTVGVQWHPERDYAGNESLFLHFLQTAGRATGGTVSR